VAVALVGRVGLEGLWMAMVPILVFAPILYLALPSGGRTRSSERPPGPGEVFRLLAGPLGLVFGISAAGAFAQRTFLTLFPIMAAGEGASETLGAGILSLYLAGQALGTLTGGILTDRVDRRRLLMVLTFLALPAHLLALGLPVGSGGAMAAAVSAGFLNMAILPPVVVLAQELVPRGAAVGSGIAMGLAWATGATFLPAAGALADAVGVREAALVSMAAFAVAFALATRPSLGR
jgi:FSR family fosmidomycin resistance protein-like MFS transporter